MRLTIKEPHIELYKDGFEGNCKLQREGTGKQLSQLVEDFDESLVIALDGAWGSGKSFFLKCWVGQHLQDHGAATQTVYFDAFQHDYLDDPLFALTLRVKEMLEKDGVASDADGSADKARRQKRKEAAIRLGKAALRVGAAIATFGATEHLGDLGDAAALAIKDEALNATNLESPEEEKFWKAQHARVKAMVEFKAALTLLTSPDEAGAPTQKLVIVIDELDRCRPDYALSLLEIIKHFFAVDGVHFVLGVNLKELQNSVKARYGAGVDAALYLQKFVTLGLRLGEPTNHDLPSDYLRYFSAIANEMGISHHNGTSIARDYLHLMQGSDVLSLRGLQKLARHIALTSTRLGNPHDGWGTDTTRYHPFLTIGLFILDSFKPEQLGKVRSRSEQWSEISSFFHLVVPESSSARGLHISTAWHLCYQQESDYHHWGELLGQTDYQNWTESYDRSVLRHLIETQVDQIQFYSS
ncbi:KAP family NTPase [Aliiroseovarius sp. S1123]|jgi:hypothetical protein|uniref:KAP family P-loop NTPase fold protein n=1 Tax=unclassified Aliiroseovarius TaxID=2623558 RepID=UPI001FF29202|nr:P-loop NTPase fold protein [Aliiroseovarius sp. S1123]MCK0170740.1 KAP family NTPase [Aliiroseovarius sp. S1123]